MTKMLVGGREGKEGRKNVQGPLGWFGWSGWCGLMPRCGLAWFFLVRVGWQVGGWPVGRSGWRISGLAD